MLASVKLFNLQLLADDAESVLSEVQDEAKHQMELEALKKRSVDHGLSPGELGAMERLMQKSAKVKAQKRIRTLRDTAQSFFERVMAQMHPVAGAPAAVPPPVHVQLPVPREADEAAAGDAEGGGLLAPGRPRWPAGGAT
ncbi:unnamed protein product [Prorocentrum cordatum]|uniref:Uncharacterized protein n=1 Tax=Prorocentrum cordatum TaxID=2364126 RepID=A0ABN9RC81_9DINO|nr:unnamed protein product [Polarella glacialis]